MTQANKITFLRILLTPLFFVLFQIAGQEWFNMPKLAQISLLVLLLILFIVSELSDLLDGIVARRMGQVSGLGKLLDPFSDVFSRITYFFCFYQVGIMPVYAFVLILWREVSMLFVRQLVQLYGQGPLPARWAGKVKAVIYFVATLLGLLLFIFLRWPEGFAQQFLAELSSLDLCLFTLDGRYFQNFWLALYTGVRSWLLPLSFLVSVIASWYSFLLYLRDFWPTLRSQNSGKSGKNEGSG